MRPDPVVETTPLESLVRATDLIAVQTEPISSAAIPRTFVSKTAAGIEPRPISITGFSYPSVNAVSTARTQGESALTSTFGEPRPPSNSILAPVGRQSASD